MELSTQERLKDLRLSDDMQYSKVTYSIQWPIHWYKLDESKFITSEEAQQKFINGNQGGKVLKWLPAHFNFERKIRLLFRECVHK